jgi:hypothetical protein
VRYITFYRINQSLRSAPDADKALSKLAKPEKAVYNSHCCDINQPMGRRSMFAHTQACACICLNETNQQRLECGAIG